MCETPRLFYGIIPLFECFMAAVLPIMLVSFLSFYKCFTLRTQGKELQSLRTFLDDKILQLETLASKDKQTTEEYLTLQIELPGFHVFTKELKDLANYLQPGFGNLLSILYSSKLVSIETAMNHHTSELFPACTCNCLNSNCRTHEKYERLLGLSKEIEGFEYDFLSLACTTSSSLQGKDIQALIHKCEKFVERLSSVTVGELCNHAVRSFRKFLLTRAETLESKLYILKENSTSTHTPLGEGDCTTDQETDFNIKLHQYGGGKQCCIAGCQNGAGMHSVTNLQGRYEVDSGLANEPWLLYVCNDHFEVDRKNHDLSTEEFPKSQVHATKLSTSLCTLCHQSKTLYNQHPCQKHVIKIFDKECQIPCDSVSSWICIFDNQSSPLQTPPLLDCFACKNCSSSIVLSRTIQAPSEFKCQFSANPLMKEIYQAMATKFLFEMTGWSIAVEQSTSFKFQFSPQRGNRQNLNERLLHLFLKDSELHYQAYILHSKVNIWGSLGKVQEQTVANISSQLYTTLKRIEHEKICCGVYDSNIIKWAKQKIGSPDPTQLIVDSEWVVPMRKANSTVYINETVRKARVKWDAGSLSTCLECQFLVKERSRSGRCEVCQKMLENSLKKHKELVPGTEERATKSDSKVKLSTLSPSQLLDRASNLSNEVRKLSFQNKRLRMMLKKQKQKLCVPNFHPTFDELSEMMNFAVTNKLLKEGSILYSFMLDALSQLKLNQTSYSDESSSEGHKPQSKPQNMRWDPLTIKLAVSLSVKCKQKGYEAVRKWLPLPSWRLVQEYRNMDTSSDPVDLTQLQKCWNEIKQRGICNLFGLHWDEIDIRSGVKLCRRTGQLIGFEDFNLPSELETDDEFDESNLPHDLNFPEEEENEDTSEDDSENTYDSDSDSTTISKPKVARQICQFFLTSLQGDFTWPVASFPVYSVTAEKLKKHMVWPLIKALDKVSDGKIKVVYGVCDGGPWNLKFFKKSSKKAPWVGQNEVTGGDIYWISDYPHMIKKLRNFMHNPNYNLTHKGRSLKWDHVAAVARQDDSPLKSKHIFIDSKSKMKVKFAREVLSESTAQAMEEPCFPYSKDETSFTCKYIRMCDKLFRIMNSVSLQSNYMTELLSVLVFFKGWHDEIEEKVKSCISKEDKKALRKQFIPLKTYHDLLVLIRGTIGLIGSIKINYPHINIVPKSLCQDDVENYFSLVRGREVSPTVQRYMEIR